MSDEEVKLPEGADDSGGEEVAGEGSAGTITAEEDALACPIIRLDHGVSACLGENCALWIPDMDELPGDCGFKFLSMFARFEIARMMRYKEIAE